MQIQIKYAINVREFYTLHSGLEHFGRRIEILFVSFLCIYVGKQHN